MSSVPGGSGESMVYALLCGGAFVGALSYVSQSFQPGHMLILSKYELHVVRNVEYILFQECDVLHVVVFSLQAYKTVVSDNARYNERIAEINARPRTEWTPKPWPPKGKSAVLATVARLVVIPLLVRLSSRIYFFYNYFDISCMYCLDFPSVLF